MPGVDVLGMSYCVHYYHNESDNKETHKDEQYDSCVFVGTVRRVRKVCTRHIKSPGHGDGKINRNMGVDERGQPLTDRMLNEHCSHVGLC